MMSRVMIAAFFALALCALVRSQSDAYVTQNGVQGVMVAGKFVPMGNKNGIRVGRGGSTKPLLTCTWVTGKGVGKKSLASLTPISGQACVDFCAKKQKRTTGKQIDAITQYKDETRKGCWCIYLIHDVSDGTDELKEFQTCYMDPKKAAEAQAAASLVNNGGFAANANACPGTGLIPMLKGCYVGNNNNRYFYNERLTIDWSKDGFPKYGKDFVCACADAAMKAGIHMFGTHFWGECWELKEEDLVSESADGCMLADGLFQTTTCNDDSKACIGMHGYGVHTVAIQ